MAAERLKYRLHPRAVSDLEDIWSYTASHWSPDQAHAYHSAVVAAFEDLARDIRRGRPVEIRRGYFRYPVGSHLVFYQHTVAGIDVVRILHRRMDIERHL